MTVLLEAKGVSAGYGKIAALSDVTVSIPQGSVVTVVGPNGAGKTTLLNVLMGLHPCTGMVRFEGQDLARIATETRLERGVCLVPETRELFATMPIEDNLLLGAFVRRREKRHSIRATLDEVYERFPRLRERRGQLAGTLSGGERQMLAVGRALMSKPKLLMLDEPSLGLAPRIVEDVFRIIGDLRAAKVSILLVEQNARAALQVADYGYVLETGVVALENKSAALLGDARVIETYLGLANRAVLPKGQSGLMDGARMKAV